MHVGDVGSGLCQHSAIRKFMEGGFKALGGSPVEAFEEVRSIVQQRLDDRGDLAADVGVDRTETVDETVSAD